MKDRTIALILPDCPGFFPELFYKLAEEIKKNGFEVVFISTSPFYERFKKVDLSKVAKVYYLDEFLKRDIPKEKYEHFPINNWSHYASFSRQSYFFGHPLNSHNALKKTKLFYQTIYDEHNVVLQISEGVSNSFIYLAHEQGAKNNIPYFGLMGARIPYHFNVHVDVTGNEVLVNEEAPPEYTPTNEVPDYMKNSQFGGLFDKEYSFFSFSFIKELLHFLFLKRSVSLETGNTKHYILKAYKISFRRIAADFYYNKVLKLFAPRVEFKKNKTYVVYPLHFYPEASTSIFAKYYDGNEFNLIKNIAFSLPENVVLVVKEHKSNVGNNSKAFYRNIKQLPNTILLTPYYNLKENLPNFDAVVTLSSTVGFEALTMDIPTYPLGEIFYQNYPGSIKINSYAELDEKLSKIEKKKPATGKNQTFNLYSKMCFPGSFNYMDKSCTNEQNLKLLLKPVFDFLKTGTMKTHHNNIR